MLMDLLVLLLLLVQVLDIPLVAKQLGIDHELNHGHNKGMDLELAQMLLEGMLGKMLMDKLSKLLNQQLELELDLDMEGMRLELDMLVALLGLALDLIYILILLVVFYKLILVLDLDNEGHNLDINHEHLNHDLDLELLDMLLKMLVVQLVKQNKLR